MTLHHSCNGSITDSSQEPVSRSLPISCLHSSVCLHQVWRWSPVRLRRVWLLPSVCHLDDLSIITSSAPPTWPLVTPLTSQWPLPTVTLFPWRSHWVSKQMNICYYSTFWFFCQFEWTNTDGQNMKDSITQKPLWGDLFRNVKAWTQRFRYFRSVCCYFWD